MFVNPKRIIYNDFQKICRTCISRNDLQPLNNISILPILQLITDINYINNIELPQQICSICIEKIKEINTFSLQCKQIDVELKQCLSDFKLNTSSNNLDTVILNSETESVRIKQEVIDDYDDHVGSYEISEQIKVENVAEESATTPKPTEFIKIENIDVDTQLEPNYDSLALPPHESNFNFESNITNINPPDYYLPNQQKDPDFTVNPVTKRKNYKCETCNKIFNKSSHLYRHKIIHTGLRPYKCETCNKSFNQSGDLKKHERIHTGVKPYKCDLCEKAFNNSSDLIKHKRLHTGEKPYKCPICGKEFRQSSDLIKHKRIHSDLYLFQCEVCNKKFKQKNHLLRHGRIHTDLKLFACDLCSKKFSQQSSLQNHKKIHFRVKKVKPPSNRIYTCDICNRIFKQSIHLKDHKRIHTGERPYVCEVCNKTFIQSSNLKAHKKIHLKIEDFTLFK